MCNIAGYIGRKDAAPILVEMMKRQEGYGGGYYTGITTHDGENLHTTKVVGDVRNLLEETEAISFVGKSGILHSRSKSGGNVEWGQPFISNDGSLSYIANGSRGKLMNEAMLENRKNAAKMLWNSGYKFRSKIEGKVGDYLQPEENICVHDSEFMCQHIAYLLDKGLAVDEAMSKTMSEFPTEIVALVMYDKCPDKIYVSRLNAPMMIGIADDGDTYLATTALAFPDDVNFRIIESLPPAATCEVFHGGYKVSSAPVEVDSIAPITPDVWHKVYVFMENMLKGKKDDPVTADAIEAEVSKFEKDGEIMQVAPIFYEILRAFDKEGRLHIVKCRSEGAFDGYMMDKTKVYID